MPRTQVPPDIRAAAHADLLAGDAPAVVAVRYGLDREMVKKWKQRLSVPAVSPTASPAERPASPARPSVVAQQQRLGELILDLLAAKLEASAAIARAASDPAWVRGQSAADLAALGQYLDATAFAIGDRLAAATGAPAPDAPRGADGDPA